jgi:hypothetical protein
VTTIVSMWFVGHSIVHLLKHLFPEHKAFLSNANTVEGRFNYVRGKVGGALAPVAGIVRR